MADETSVDRADDLWRIDLGDVGMVVREKAHAQIIFQEGVHAVERPTGRTAGDGDEFIAGDDPQILGAESIHFEADGTASHRVPGTDKHMPFRPGNRVNDLQLRTGRLENMKLKLFRGVHLTGKGRDVNDDVPSVEVVQIHSLGSCR